MKLNELKTICKGNYMLRYKKSNNEAIIFLGYTDAPENYGKYEEEKVKELLNIILSKEYNPIVLTKREFGFTRKEIRIKIEG